LIMFPGAHSSPLERVDGVLGLFDRLQLVQAGFVGLK
jgi:hypothetical protein